MCCRKRQIGYREEQLLNNFLKRFYLFIVREKGRDGDREGEKHQCIVISHAPSTGDMA